MLNTAKLIAFAATADAKASLSFYQDVLGLRLISDTPFALAFDANGTTLRLQKVPAVDTPAYTTVGWAVNDLRELITALSGHQILTERFNGLRQDALGIWTAPDGTQVAWFKDPDGNLLSLSQEQA